MKRAIVVVLLLLLTAAASDLPYVRQGRVTGRGDPDRPTMELVWEARLPETDVPPPYGTIVQTWYINAGRSYDGAGIVWVADSNRFFTVGQGQPSGQQPKVYSFDPINPSGTIRDENWDLTQPNLGGSSQDLPWGIGYDPDSSCWWLTWLADGGISNPCHAVRFQDKRWRGTPADTWNLRNVEPPNWYSTFDKREDDAAYFIAHHVYSTMSAARFYKVNPYLKVSYGYYPNDVPPVSERAACWVGDTLLHMSTGGWNQAQFIGRDSTGRIFVRASCGSLASNDIWVPMDAHPESTVWMFATYNDGSNTVLKVSTGLTHAQLPTRARHNVGARTILAPAGVVDSGQSITPQVVVRNSGRFDEELSVVMRIGNTYRDSQYVALLPAGRMDTIDFAAWTATARESLNAVAWTLCATDSFPRDDTTRARFLVRVKDVAVTEILAPLDTIDSGMVVRPRAMVWNFGNVTAVFPVEFRIGAWVSIQTVTLGAMSAQEVSAPDSFISMPGNYIHRVFAALAGDLHPENNVVYDTFYVRGTIANDVAVVELLAPRGAYDTTMTVTPRATVRNNGNSAATFWTFMTATQASSGQVVYSESLNTMLGAGGQITLDFPDVRFTSIGRHIACCSTYFPPDQNNLNDLIRQSFYVFPELAGDVGVTQIIAPPGVVDTNATVVPTATWRNYSSSEVTTFAAYALLTSPTVGRTYTQETLLTLNPGATITVAFPGHNVGMDTGWWVCRCSTYAAGDTMPGNDWLDKRFQVATGSPWRRGWVEVQSMPPGAKACKDGAFLARDEGSNLIYATKGNKSGEFYCYDAVGDSDGVWTSLTSWPTGTEGKLAGKGANGTSDNAGNVYAAKGNNTLGFWRYNVDSTAWRQLADVPLGASQKKVKGGTDLVYVMEGDTGWVYLLKGYKTEFFRFNTVSGRWDTTLPAAPTGANAKWDKGSWLVYDGGTTLYAHKAKYHELWTFDLVTHTWGSSARPGMPLTGMLGKKKKSKDGGSAAYYDGFIYALKGGNTQEFWKYAADSAGAWTELETIPAYGSTAKKKRVKAGGDMVSYGNGYFFALKGNKTVEFWRYGIAAPAGSRSVLFGGEQTAGARRVSSVMHVGPNPLVGGWAELSYNLPQAGLVRVSVFDITGRSVAGASFVAGHSGTARLDLRRLSAGVYLVKLEASGLTRSQKLVVQ